MMIASSSVVGMAQTQLESGIDLTNMDLTANPATDFYQYATGGWQKKNPLPAAYSRYGSFDQLQEDNNKRINGILSDLLYLCVLSPSPICRSRSTFFQCFLRDKCS